jgi:hypothetical protein
LGNMECDFGIIYENQRGFIGLDTPLPSSYLCKFHIRAEMHGTVDTICKYSLEEHCYCYGQTLLLITVHSIGWIGG